jgi:O-antigen/teichoic acid export membrane protein
MAMVIGILEATRLLAASSLLAASDAAFGIVFGLFVVAFIALTVLTISWAVRRDRPKREAWRRRMEDEYRARGGPPTNGHRPGRGGPGAQ